MVRTETARNASRRLERWLLHRDRRKPTAVILGASSNGLSFVRSLARRGIATLLLDSDPLLGIYTHYGKVALLPAAENCPDQWLELLQFVGSRLPGPGVLFVTSDRYCLLVSEHREILGRYFLFVLPARQTLEQIVNKRSQYEAARAAGIPIPVTHFPESPEHARECARGISYPCILKPYTSLSNVKLARKKVLRVDSADELIAAYDRITALGVPLMIQQLIGGDDGNLFGYLGFWDQDGRERAWLTKRKLRQYPRDFGDGSLQVTVEAPEVAELSRRLLRALCYSGFVGVEFKFDSQERVFRLIEINARTVSGNQLAIAAGVDFPWLGYQYLTGAELAGVSMAPFQVGVKYVNEEWDFQAFWALRKSGELGLWDWLRSLRDVQARAFGDLGDPFPLLAGIGRLLFGRLNHAR